MRSIKVRCPASTANLGPGYDVFGMALKEPFDIVEAERCLGEGVEIEAKGYETPLVAEENTGGYVALRMMERLNLEARLRIRIDKGIRPRSGLGSSGATAAGVAFAVNKLFDLGLDHRSLIEYASQGEVVAAGAAHADNVAPALLGGFTIIVSRDPLEVLSFEPPEDLGVVVALPDILKASTKAARDVLPKEVPISKLNYNIGHASALAAGMASKNLELIKIGMEDAIVEVARAQAGIVKEYDAFKSLGRELDVGIAVSGAGPAILGVVEKSRRPQLAEAMRSLFQEAGYGCQVYVTEPGRGVYEIGRG